MLVEKEDDAVNVKGTMYIHETPGMEDSKVENKIIKSKNNNELH